MATGESVFRGRDAAVRKASAAVFRQMKREYLVIGGSAGVGLEIVRELSSRGDVVHAASRTQSGQRPSMRMVNSGCTLMSSQARRSGIRPINTQPDRQGGH